MGFIAERIADWMVFEPVIGLLMIVATGAIFLNAYQRHTQPHISIRLWIRQILEASSIALVFLGLLWGFRAILNDNYHTFMQTHGRVSEVNYGSVQKIWGSPHIQRELQVQHFIEKTYQEEIPRDDPSKPPLYKTEKRTEQVEQNSILSSKGEVKLRLSKRKKGSAYYSGFVADFVMDYKVINDSLQPTEARFEFPLQSGQLIYSPFEVLENGANIRRLLRFSPDNVGWKRTMQPGETLDITVKYVTRGLDYFYYQIPQAREINDFTFKVIVDNLPLADINYPEGCLPPEKENIRASPDGRGVELQWDFHSTLTTAGMGIALPTPQQPGAMEAAVLKNSPYALMLLVISISLTFLVQGKCIRFLEVILLSASYSLLFVTLASASDFATGFWGSVLFGAALSLALSYTLFRRHDKTTVRAILGWVAFFTLVYPLSGLFPDLEAAFNGWVVVILVVYLFILSWHYRIKHAA